MNQQHDCLGPECKCHACRLYIEQIGVCPLCGITLDGEGRCRHVDVYQPADHGPGCDGPYNCTCGGFYDDEEAQEAARMPMSGLFNSIAAYLAEHKEG